MFHGQMLMFHGQMHCAEDIPRTAHGHICAISDEARRDAARTYLTYLDILQEHSEKLTIGTRGGWGIFFFFLYIVCPRGSICVPTASERGSRHMERVCPAYVHICPSSKLHLTAEAECAIIRVHDTRMRQ